MDNKISKMANKLKGNMQSTSNQTVNKLMINKQEPAATKKQMTLAAKQHQAIVNKQMVNKMEPAATNKQQIMNVKQLPMTNKMEPAATNKQQTMTMKQPSMTNKMEAATNKAGETAAKQSSSDDKQKLLRQIQMYSLAAFEAALYLDTHNTDQEALAYYAKQRDKTQELEKEYEKKYGPLMSDSSTNTKVWEWSKGPWPWEYSAN